MILPYIDQGSVLNTTNLDYSVLDPRNVPPPYGTAPGGVVRIAAYKCPSKNTVEADYGPVFVAAGIPNMGTCILGESDYGPIRGYTDTFRNACAPGSPLTIPIPAIAAAPPVQTFYIFSEALCLVLR